MHGPLNVKIRLSEIRTVSLQHNRRIARLSNLIFERKEVSLISRHCPLCV